MGDWATWAKERTKQAREISQITDQRWEGEEPAYRIVGHPEEKQFQLVVDKTGGTIRVLGLYLRTVAKNEKNYAELVEKGNGVVYHDIIYHFRPYPQERSEDLAQQLAEKAIKKIAARYEKIPHPEKKTVKLLLVKLPGMRIALLGRHIKTIPNTAKNWREALRLQKQGSQIRATDTEIHFYKSMSKAEHKQLAAWIRTGRK